MSLDYNKIGMNTIQNKRKDKIGNIFLLAVDNYYDEKVQSATCEHKPKLHEDIFLSFTLDSAPIYKNINSEFDESSDYDLVLPTQCGSNESSRYSSSASVNNFEQKYVKITNILNNSCKFDIQNFRAARLSEMGAISANGGVTSKEKVRINKCDDAKINNIVARLKSSRLVNSLEN